MTLFSVTFEFRGTEPSMTILVDADSREAALLEATYVMADKRPSFGIELVRVYRVEINAVKRVEVGR